MNTISTSNLGTKTPKEKHKSNSSSINLFDQMTLIDYKDFHFIMMGTPVNSDLPQYIEVSSSNANS